MKWACAAAGLGHCNAAGTAAAVLHSPPLPHIAGESQELQPPVRLWQQQRHLNKQLISCWLVCRCKDAEEPICKFSTVDNSRPAGNTPREAVHQACHDAGRIPHELHTTSGCTSRQ
jgi:hypothetical protein